MSFPVPRHAAITSLALAIAAPCALAQTATPTGAPDTVFVTATRTAQAASDLLADTLTISADQIAESGADSLTELLQKQRGIEVVRNGGAGTSASVFIRGASTQQNIVLVDGVRIGSSTLGGANWAAIPLAAIDHIEIVYGPLSSMYGADAIGGVVQIFTRKGAGAPRLTTAVGAGSDRTRSADASISGGVNNVSYALSAGKQKSDGFSATTPGNYSYNPDRDGYTRDNVNAQFGLELAKGYDIGLVFMHSKLDAQYDSDASAFDARNLQKLENVGIFSKNQILPNWNAQFQLTQAKDKSGYVDQYGGDQVDTKQTDFTWQNDVRLGADTLQLLYEHRKEAVVSGSTQDLTRERSTGSFAAAYNLNRGAHLASASLRNDDSSQYGSTTTGAIGYGYRITPALRASASFGTSFRAPTFNDLYYPGYGVATNQPEKGRNTELGLHYNDGVTQLGVVAYRNRLRDLLVSTDVCPVEAKSHPYGCAYNVNQAVLEGLTLSGRRQLGDFAVNANIDLQNPHDETSGKLLVRRARQHANLALDYSAAGLTAGVEWQLSGKRYDDVANSSTLGGYGLVNLYATYAITRDWSVLARWNNAGDKQYALARYYGSAGSNVFAGVRYGF